VHVPPPRRSWELAFVSGFWGFAPDAHRGALLHIIHREQQSVPVRHRKCPNCNPNPGGPLLPLLSPVKRSHCKWFNITELAEYGVIKGKKQKKMVGCTGFEPRSPAWLLATLPTEPHKHSTGVVYCTYLTHFHVVHIYVV